MQLRVDDMAVDGAAPPAAARADDTAVDGATPPVATRVEHMMDDEVIYFSRAPYARMIRHYWFVSGFGEAAAGLSWL